MAQYKEDSRQKDDLLRSLQISEKRIGEKRTEASRNDYISTPEKQGNPYVTQETTEKETLPSSTISYENKQGTHAIKVVHSTAIDLSKKSQVTESKISSALLEEKSYKSHFNLNLTEVSSSPQGKTRLLEFSPEP